MSCPIEKNSDGKKWRRKRTQRKCDINSIGQPAPLSALVMNNSSSPTLSEEFSGITTEEEDMELAKSLVLLSRGSNSIDQAAAEQSSETPTSPPPSIKMEKISAEIEIERHDKIVPSRQLVEPTAQTTNSDFLCKTCNKRFRTFQALGGHRASHKKPKLDSDEPKVQSSTDTGTTSSGTIIKLEYITNIKNEIQVNSSVVNPPVLMEDNKPRVHKCQECSAEFSSGQALGGHMRKHKPLKGGGDASKNRKAEVATQQPSNDGSDRIAIQQSPSGSLDRIAIQQPMNGGLDRIAIQQLSNCGLERIAIQQQPDGGLDRIAIIQQQPNGGLELDLNLPAQPDQIDTIQQPPAIPPHDGNPVALTMQLFPGSSAVTNFL